MSENVLFQCITCILDKFIRENNSNFFVNVIILSVNDVNYYVKYIKKHYDELETKFINLNKFQKLIIY